MTDNFFSNNDSNFYWFFGCVEDRDDPLRIGRVKLRILGYHTDDKEQLPTDDLPWAMPIMPANSASTSGIGWSPTGPVEGTWVFGFFMDGAEGQQPAFLGTINAVPESNSGSGGSGGDGSGNSPTSGGADGSGADYSIPPSGGSPPAKTGNVEQDNIAAYLWTLRVCEGTAGADGYRTMFTGKLFNNGFKDHPRITNSATVRGRTIYSTAAGAYQFLTSTWDELARKLRLPDFGPASQDKAAVQLLKQCGALQYVKEGNITEASKRATRIWASLPGNNYNQGGKSLAAVKSYFTKGGGTLTA
jgi:muramidase (phage lysozyme)